MKKLIAIFLMLLSVNVYATDVFECYSKPYMSRSHVSFYEQDTGKVSDFMMYKNGQALLNTHEVPKNYKLMWYETDSSNSNTFSIEGVLSNGQPYSIQAKDSDGSLTIGTDRFKLKCEWTR